MMKHLRWLTIGATIVLSLCLFAPLNLQAASSHKSQTKTQVVKKTALKKSVIKKSVSKKGSSKKTVTQAKNSVDKKAGSERDIWMQRAKGSQVLMGKASWYGKDFHNKATASGLNYDMYTFTAAHRTLPMGTVVKVTDQHNGKSVMVCVTDRGPFVQGRIIDLSYAAAKQLDLNKRGVGNVKLEVVSDETGAPLKSDQAYFIRYAAENGKTKVGPFKAFADAAAMHEALRQAHPEAEVVLDQSRKK